MRKLALMCALSLAACAPSPMDPVRAAEECEIRARAAQGPTGNVSMGVNSQTGPFVDASVGITSDFVQGADPLAVYQSCVMRLTGNPPIRPPMLR